MEYLQKWLASLSLILRQETNHSCLDLAYSFVALDLKSYILMCIVFIKELLTSQTLSRQSSFIPRTCNLWNVLPSSCFPESYNLPSSKSKINKLDLISLSSYPFAFFFLPCWGFAYAIVAFPQHNSLNPATCHLENLRSINLI